MYGKKITKEARDFAVKGHGISGNKYDSFVSHVNKTPQNMTPYILEERQMNVSQMDVYSRLMMDRIIFFNHYVSAETMGIITAQALFLDSVENKDIKLLINSGGGDVISGMGFYDTIMTINSDVETTIVGMAASMGAILATSGTKGKRNMLKHSRLMIHDIRGGNEGTYEDQKISFELTKELRNELFNVLSFNSGQSVEEINKLCQRDYWMKHDKAIELGFMDKVIEYNSRKNN